MGIRQQYWNDGANYLSDDSLSISVKRVRFAVCDLDRIECRVLSGNEACSESKKADAWYSEDEFAEMRACCSREINLTLQSDYQHHFMQLNHACGEDNPDGSTFALSRAKEGAKSAIFLSLSNFRGHERSMNGNIKTYRKEFLDIFLDLQDDCCYRGKFQPCELEETLAELCMHNSRRSRRIALLLGFGDSIAANEIISVDS